MRDQYAGDISDYLKLSFLRAILHPNQTLGVAWYYIDKNDGRSDGRHREYLQSDVWAKLDLDLHSSLQDAASAPAVSTLQGSEFWLSQPVFHGAPVVARRSRNEWAADMYAELKTAEVIFVDPDNGVSASAKAGKKHALKAEILEFALNKRPVVMIRFPHRNTTHRQQLEQHHEMFKGLVPVTVRTRVSVKSQKSARTQPRIRWFTVLNCTYEMRARIDVYVNKLNLMPQTEASVHSFTWHTVTARFA